MLSQVKYEFIRTPLERPLLWIRSALYYHERWRHPEFLELYLEPWRIHAALKRAVCRNSNCIDVSWIAVPGEVLSASRPCSA